MGKTMEKCTIEQARASAPMLTSTKLDVGCGSHRLEGAVGLDIMPASGVDIVHDVNKAPWPLPDNHFEFIRCQHAIEHFRDVHSVVREMWRVGRNGAQIEFVTPHYSSYASWGDPTHVHHFALASLPILFDQALGAGKFEVVSCRLKFTGAVLDIFGWLIYKASPKQYEKRFAWMFPSNEIHVTIRLIK